MAAIGLFVLLAGLVGGGVQFILSSQRPSQAVEGFARAPVGCTTTLEFTEVGSFYVFVESGVPLEAIEGGCEPIATPSIAFDVAFDGDRLPAAVTSDTSITYDLDGFDGQSLLRVEIGEPGRYSVAVSGNDLGEVAALGRDPSDGVDELRQAALVTALGGVVVGLLLLTVSGRRSKRASQRQPVPISGWVPGVEPDVPTWPPAAPNVMRHGGDSGPTQPERADPAPMSDEPIHPTWGAPTGTARPLPPPDTTTPLAPPRPPGRSLDD